MRDEEKNTENLGTINFLDVDTNSGKVLTIEEDSDEFMIPEVNTEESNDVQMTPEMESLVKGTYIEEQKEAQEKAEKLKLEQEKKTARIIVGIGVALVVLIYGLISFLSLSNVAKQRDIKAKTIFLTDNAVYANDIKTFYQQLASNASNYQDGLIYQSSMKTKATDIRQKIDSRIESLQKHKDDFSKFGADSLYAVIEARYSEVRNLALFQANGGEARTIVMKTNEFIVNENDNAAVYNSTLKQYLTDNSIPYKELNGQIIYTYGEEK